MYRNDHDAALARIDVLETELEKSRAERERLLAEKPPAKSRHRNLAVALVMVAMCAIGMAALRRMPAPNARPEPAASGPAAYDDPVRRVCALP